MSQGSKVSCAGIESSSHSNKHISTTINLPSTNYHIFHKSTLYLRATSLHQDVFPTYSHGLPSWVILFSDPNFFEFGVYYTDGHVKLWYEHDSKHRSKFIELKYKHSELFERKITITSPDEDESEYQRTTEQANNESCKSASMSHHHRRSARSARIAKVAGSFRLQCFSLPMTFGQSFLYLIFGDTLHSLV